MDVVTVAETFISLQGESTYAGMPCFFIRLAGCNLHCRYCDTAWAYGPGTVTPIDALVTEACLARAALIEITGGEPLEQAGFPALARQLRESTERPILVETNGSRDISVVPHGVVTIMDVKCPGSGMADANDEANIGRLRPVDEVKFVIGDRHDYAWARRRVREWNLVAHCAAIHFGTVASELDASVLGRWILEDALPVRLHVQIHKQLGMK